MTFLDQQGVGPCGHAARDKGILIKVVASCLSHQVPRKLALSVHGCRNEKNTGDLFYKKIFNSMSLESEIADAQHVRGIDITRVRCGQDSIQDKCLCLPQANWQTWSARDRIYTVRGEDKGRKAWYMLLLVDDDATILSFIERTQGENAGVHSIDFNDYGQVLKSGWGEEPTDEEKQAAMKKYEWRRPKQKDE